MSSGVFLNVCQREYQISARQSEPSKCSKFMDKNTGVILIALAVIFATCAALIAYGYIPAIGSMHPMYTAGCLSISSTLCLVGGILKTLIAGGCLIVRNVNTVHTPPTGLPQPSTQPVVQA